MDAIVAKNFGVEFLGPDNAQDACASIAPAGIDWRVPEGAFALLTGNTGLGKTTLLKSCVPALAPRGAGVRTRGSLQVNGRAGYVAQNPQAQIVCDSVRRELAFGSENANMPPSLMRRRIAEVATFLGIDSWMGRRTSALSGGQKQILALAGTLAAEPDILLLDEPTAQLDPIAAARFIDMLARAWRMGGITVVVATHNAAAFAHLATHSLNLPPNHNPSDLQGPTINFGEGEAPASTCGGRRGEEAASKPYNSAVQNTHLNCGIQNSRDRQETSKKSDKDEIRFAEAANGCNKQPAPATSFRPQTSPPTACALKNVYFAYDAHDPWVLNDATLNFGEGGIHALVGGNGCGKSTVLKLLAGVLKPRRGRVRRGCAQAYLPQNVESLFVCDSALEELMEWSSAAGFCAQDALEAAVQFGVSHVLERHPFDLSGGEQRLLAIAKLSLLRPSLLLADEPTCGLDGPSREAVAQAFESLAADGKTVVFATHDLDFAARAATDITLLFDGAAAVAEEPPADFFANNLFYKPQARDVRGL